MTPIKDPDWQLFHRLDTLSRTRALTAEESAELEQVMQRLGMI